MDIEFVMDLLKLDRRVSNAEFPGSGEKFDLMYILR